MSTKKQKAAWVPRCEWPFEEVMPDEHTRVLETTHVHVARIEPSQANTILQFIRHHLPPLEGLEHCRRIKRHEPDQGRVQLEVILCQQDAMTSNALLALLVNHDFEKLTPEVRPVPRYAPVNRTQFLAWRDLWPLVYREDTRLDPKFTMDDLNLAKTHMRSLLTLSTVQARIVDPATNTIVAEGKDTREDGHPLHHAVMNCIDAVGLAERSRHQDGNRAKRKLDAPKSYLCTGYDLYCSHEPCAMCAMALVHSRIGRVFYSVPTKTGCLGTVHKIHSHPGLNHHYRVFQGLLKKEIPSDCDDIQLQDA